MFSYNIGGVPVLKVVPFDDIKSDTLYLSSDQSCVLSQDRDTDIYTVFDLTTAKMRMFDASCSYELKENHPSCAVLFPSDSVKVSIRLEIMGGDNAN